MKELNIINKLLTIVLIGISLYFCNNDVYIYVLCCIGLICCLNYRCWYGLIFFIFPIIGVISGITIDYFDIGRLYYLSIMIGEVIIVVRSLTEIEKRYIFDKTMYKYKNYKKMRKHLNKWYYKDKFNENMESMRKYNNASNYKLLVSQAHIKTKKDLDDIYILNRIRFYQLYSTKRPMFPDVWRKYDTIYLVAIVLIFVIILI